MRRGNHFDSGDSWGTSKASLKSNRNRTTAQSRTPPKNKIESVKSRIESLKNNGNSATKSVKSVNSPAASVTSPSKSVSSQKSVNKYSSTMTIGLGSIYSKPSPFLGEWPSFKPLGYSMERKLSSRKSSDNDMKSNKSDTKIKNKKDENGKINQSSIVPSDKEIDNSDLFSENDLSPSDKMIFREGIIYKKNSTGFFRNWKKVQFCITKRYMR